MFYSKMEDGSNILVIDSKENVIRYNGFIIQNPPNMDKHHSFSIKNGKLYANGYMWTGTTWKRSLRAIIEYIF